MKLTAGQAAKETGTSIPTIVRAFKNGRISGSKLEGGGYEFDASEVFRVFPRVTRDPDAETASLGSETPNETHSLGAEVAVLREKLRLVETYSERERDQLSRQIEDLRQDRDHWREQAERTTRLLPPPGPATSPPPAVAERPSLLRRLFGKGNG